jgi:CRISPR/Cas system CSM-associated protein Csm3 (group 7 of RAMP superfamily)
VDLTSRTSLLAALSGDAKPTPIEPDDTADDVLRIRLDWRTKRPVLVGAAAPTATADLAPLLSYRPESDGSVPVLPGASVKGVLRSAAERVVRTLRDTGPPDDNFVAELDATAELPVFEAVFGSRERAGAARIADTAATVSASPDAVSWSRERTHVAIDRWTGGASEGRLFTVDETQGVTWSDLEIELDLHIVPKELWRAAVLLLGVAVGQLHDGGIGFGHGTTRGLGEIEVTGTQVTTPDGIPPYSGQGWWAWLREVADGGDLATVLGLERDPA